MTATIVFGSAILFTLVLLVILFIKNEITFKIQNTWSEDVWKSKMDGEDLDWSDIPSYNKTLYNLFIWKYKPLQRKEKK